MELDRIFVRLFVIHNLPVPVLYALRINGLYHAKLPIEAHKGFMEFMTEYAPSGHKRSGIIRIGWYWDITPKTTISMLVYADHVQFRHSVVTVEGFEYDRRNDIATTQLDVLRFQVHIANSFVKIGTVNSKEKNMEILYSFFKDQLWVKAAGIWRFGDIGATLVMHYNYVTVKFNWRGYTSSQSIVTSKDLEEVKERILRLMHAETHNLYP